MIFAVSFVVIIFHNDETAFFYFINTRYIKKSFFSSLFSFFFSLVSYIFWFCYFFESIILIFVIYFLFDGVILQINLHCARIEEVSSLYCIIIRSWIKNQISSKINCSEIVCRRDISFKLFVGNWI